MRHVFFGWFVLGLAVVSAALFARQTLAGAKEQPDLDFCGQSVGADGKADLEKLAREAASETSEAADSAISALRDAGPKGLEALLSTHRATLERHMAQGAVNSTEPDWQRLKAALDAVSGQHSCYASRLFWHTDLEAAKAAAKQSGKPILSLRMMGNLTDEFSCANSRFFRSTLYSNEEVSRVLREQFVLHWQSVRPVPKVTIDFGDGRKLDRTLTGNSIHYILDAEGRPVDALPGLYGPKAFLRGLAEGRNAVAATKPLVDDQRTAFLQLYHQGKARQLLTAWQRDLEQLGLHGQDVALAPDARAARAAAANKRAMSKMVVETPLLAGVLADASVLSDKTDDAVWGRIAQLHAADAELDAASVAFIRNQKPTAVRAGALAESKRAVAAEDPLLRLVRSFQNTIAIDTVRNEYMFRRQIHEWFASGDVPLDVDVFDLNERVYAQLFLTPSNDPWLGLLSGEVYTALENNGMRHE